MSGLPAAQTPNKGESHLKNFSKLASTANISPLLVSIESQPDLWNQNTLRTSHPDTPHKDVDDIWLWFNELKDDVASTIDDVQTHPYPAWWALPQARAIVFDLMRLVEATQLGRCVISRLPPGKKILPHVDQGSPATFYQRFQICLQSAPGCNFTIEDEQVCFKPGEIWLINNKAEHSVVNNSNLDRISMVVDLRLPVMS